MAGQMIELCPADEADAAVGLCSGGGASFYRLRLLQRTMRCFQAWTASRRFTHVGLCGLAIRSSYALAAGVLTAWHRDFVERKRARATASKASSSLLSPDAPPFRPSPPWPNRQSSATSTRAKVRAPGVKPAQARERLEHLKRGLELGVYKELQIQDSLEELVFFDAV